MAVNFNRTPILNIETQDEMFERLRKKLNSNFSSITRYVDYFWQKINYFGQKINDLCQKINDRYHNFDTLYPVGCVIMTTTANRRDPRLQYGTWVKINDQIIAAAGTKYPLKQTANQTVVTSVSGEGVSSTTEQLSIYGINFYERTM